MIIALNECLLFHEKYHSRAANNRASSNMKSSQVFYVSMTVSIIVGKGRLIEMSLLNLKSAEPIANN